MHHVLAPNGLPTPPASPLSWGQPKYMSPQHQHHQHQQHHHFYAIQQPRYVPVAPEDRIGMRLEESLQLTGIIGTGAYGVVYEAVDLKTNIRYAVKALSKLNQDGTPLEARQLEYQDREIRLHYAASAHPNVVSMLKIIDVYPDCLYVVLEYCPEGDLFYNITECGHFVGNDELARRVFLQVLDAVAHLHQLGIYHRDLKPENILVANGGDTLKLADFGLATNAEQSEDYGCGSTFYMSPECLGQSTASRPFYYCAPNDVWSLGVILVNLTCGRNPWKQASHEDSTYYAYTRNAGFLKTILPLTDELDAILARIFCPNPDQRITLPQLRQLILACPRLTTQPPVDLAAPVAHCVSDDSDLDSSARYTALSPASSISSSHTYTSSISSAIDIDGLVEDDGSDACLCHDMPEALTPPPISSLHTLPSHNDMLAVYDAGDASLLVPAPYGHQQQQPQQHQQHQHQQPMYQQPMVLQQPMPMPVVPMHQPQALPPMPSMPCNASSRFPLWDWMLGKNAQSAQQFRALHPMSLLPIPHSVFLPGCH